MPKKPSRKPASTTRQPLLKPRGYFADSADIELRVLFSLYKRKESSRLVDISADSGLGSQLVRYHLPKLIKKGLVLRTAGDRYAIQGILKDESLMEYLFPLVEKVAKSVDASQAGCLEDAVFNSVTFFMLFHTLEM